MNDEWMRAINDVMVVVALMFYAGACTAGVLMVLHGSGMFAILGGALALCCGIIGWKFYKLSEEK